MCTTKIRIGHLVVLTLTTLPVAALLAEGFAPQLNAQQYYPTRGVASGEVQTVSNGALTIVTDSPAYNIPLGTKVDFVLGPETMIFAPQGRAAISDIHNYRRATVQYDRKGGSKVAVHIRLFQPVQAAKAQAPLASQRATAHDRAGAEAHNLQGVNLVFKGDLDRATAEFRTAIRLDPTYATAHSNLGNALDDKGDLDGAVAECRTAIRLDPKDATAHSSLCRDLDRKGDLDGAIGECRTAIRLDPKDDVAHNNLGNALKDKGDLDGAIAEFRTAIPLNSFSGLPHYNLGLVLERKGDMNGAMGEYRAACSLNPKNTKYCEAAQGKKR